MTTESPLTLLYTRDQIHETVKRLAGEIARDYAGKKLLIIGILKGSFMFIADLIRELPIPAQVEFVILSSYGAEADSPGKVKLVKGLQTDLHDKHVLVAEDIIDRGYTIAYLLNYLRHKRPLSFKLCVLLDKPERRNVPVIVDYRGFVIPDKFVVGYGLDYDEKYRYLPDIHYLD